MQDSAHIADPEDDSLESRMRYFQTVSKAHERVKESLSMLHEKHWADNLGEREEVEKAAEITANSLHRALQDLDEDDFQEAEELGYVKKKDLRKFIELKRAQEMRDIRDEKYATSEDTQQFQR